MIRLPRAAATRLAVALKDHRESAGIAWHPSLLELEREIVTYLGQEATGMDIGVEVGDVTRETDPVRMLTVSETADRLNLSERQTRRLIDGQTIPSIKLGGSIRIPALYVRALQQGAQPDQPPEGGGV